jgi:hypothetical protein
MQAPLTASAVMRFLDELEAQAEAFYQALAARYAAQGATFSRCAAACAKNRVLVARTYQETISDALETGYAFEGLDLAPYAEMPDAAALANLDAAVQAALALEERAARCYEDVADRAESLLATIPRALRRAAEVRRRNGEMLGRVMAS